MSDSIQFQIDAMVASAGGRVEASNRLTSVDGTKEHVKVHHDGTVEYISSPNEPERIPDDGTLDTNFERANFQQRIADLKAKLDEVRFNPQTGERYHTIQGHAREVLEMQLNNETNGARYAEERFRAIEAQRARDAVIRQAELEEREIYRRVTGGDPAKMARLQELLGDEEMKTAAKAILAKRFEVARGSR